MADGRLTSIDELDGLVRKQGGSRAGERLRRAIEMSRELSAAGDALIERFVAEGRAAGLSWTEIGELFGTSKQAAQKRYGPASAAEGDWPGRWAPAARYALDQARAQALELGHNYIGTEHLLIGLLAVEDGVATSVLGELGITREAIVAEIAEPYLPHPCDGLAVMPRLKQALANAARIAEGLGRRLVDSEYLLAGIVAVPDSLAVKLLSRQGASAADVREGIAERLGIDPQRLLPPHRGRRRRPLLLDVAR